MRKLMLLLGMVVLFCAAALAQTRQVKGVVRDKQGAPVPYASVIVKGTNTGVTADDQGGYTIQAKNGDFLVVSSIGFETKEFKVTNDSDVFDVALGVAASDMNEVVVTALGIKREKKALGFSLQEVGAEQLTVAKSVDVSSSLAGKVAGVQLLGSPSSTYDNANIIIRGVQGLGVNTPLYVVDGTITDQSAVLMDNVENISVLKGQAAAALYGSRGQNGVVMITTKKGTRKKMTSVDLNLGVTFENLSIMPKYQNQYAGGYSSAYTSKNSLGAGYLDDAGYYIFNYDPSVHPASWASFQGQKMLEYGADESWGPKIDGSLYRPYYSWYPGAEFGVLSPMVAQPDNVKNFFNTGTNLNNSIAFNSGAENFNFRMVYGNQNRTLVLPNSRRDQHQLNLSGSYDLSKVFTLSSDLAYTTSSTKGKPAEGYRLDGLNVMQNFNQWFQRQLDIEKMKTYRQPDGSLNSWNIGDPNATGDFDTYSRPQYWDNPYFVVQENYGTQRLNRLVGNVGLNVRFNNHLNLQSYARMNTYTNENDFKIASGGLNLDQYSISQNQYKEMNYETNLVYKNRFGDFSVDGLLGGNHRNTYFSQLAMNTEGGLSTPNYFDIAASIARPTVSRSYSKAKVNSVYAKASFGWRDMIYAEGTIRNDWSSSLPADNNSYLYPSLSTSFIFTELLGNSNVLTFGKLRASYASVGSDIAPHSLDLAINNGSFFGSNPSATIGNSYRGGNIKPSLTNAIELGLELKFFRRFGLDVSVYKNNNINQILNVDVSPASGFSNAQINAGDIVNKGIEVSLSGALIRDKNFTWDVILNWAKNKNEVKELAEGINTYLYATRRYDIRLEHRVGEEWGTFYGRKWRTNEAGQTLINASGQPEYDINQKIGTVLPDWTGGMFNSFRYKSFDLTFSMDWQKGGLFYSETRNFNSGTGLSAETVGVNDKGFDFRDYPGSYSSATGNAGNGGIRIPGVFTSTGKENNRYLSARAYWYTARQRDASNQLLDASYIKLREIRFGYSLPASFMAKTKFAKAANIGLIVQNAWLIWATTKEYGIDPSELETLGYEGGQLSATRQIGGNLRITF